MSEIRKGGGGSLTDAIERITEVAWDAYEDYRKAPHTEKAGQGYADPDYDLSIDWIEASRKIKEAEQRQKDPTSPSRILLINGAARSEHTCPGEMSKTFRLAKIAREVFDAEREFETELLDLSRLASEFGRVIYPCMARTQRRTIGSIVGRGVASGNESSTRWPRNRATAYI